MSAASAILAILSACSGGGSAPDSTSKPADDNRGPSIPTLSQVETLKVTGEVISAQAPSSASHDTPTVVFNGNGDGVAVWTLDNGSNRSLLYSTYVAADGRWSAEAILLSDLNSDFSIRVQSNGSSFALLWLDRSDVYARILTIAPAVSWSETKTLTIPTTRARRDTARIASDGKGYLITWYAGSVGFLAMEFNGQQWPAEPMVIDKALSTDFQFGSGSTIVSVTGGPTGYTMAWLERSRTNNTAVRVRARYLNREVSPSWTATETLSPVLDDYFGRALRVISNPFGFLVRWDVGYDGAPGEIQNRIGVAVYDTRISTTAWNAPVMISDRESTSIMTVSSVAAGPDGFGIEWLEEDSASFSFTRHARLYDTSSGTPDWGADSILETGPMGDSGEIVASVDGYAIAWESELKIKRSVYAGGAWSATPNVYDPGTLASIRWYALDSDGAGYGMAIHIVTPGTRENQVYSSAYGQGTWSAPVAMTSAFTTRTVRTPFPTPSFSHDAIGYWITTPTYELDAGHSYSNIVTRRFGSSLENETRLTTQRYRGSAHHPKLVTLANGNIMAVWQEYESNYHDLYASVRSGSIWSAPIRLNNPDNVDERDVYDSYTQIVANGNQVAVIWNAYNRPTLRVFNGSSWESSVTIKTVSSDLILDAHVVPYNNSFAISWIADHFDPDFLKRVGLLQLAVDPAQISTPVTLTEVGRGGFGPDRTAIAVSENNSLVAVYVDGDDLKHLSIKSIAWNDGAVDTPQLIRETDSFTFSLSLNANTAGDLFASWSTQGSGTFSSHRSASSGLWSAAQSLTSESVAAYTASSATRTLTAWFAFDQVGSMLYSGKSAQRISSDRFEPTTYVTTDVAGGLASSGSRFLLTANARLDDLNDHAFVSLFDGSAWTHLYYLDDPATTLHRAEPHVTGSGSNFALAWTQWDTVDANSMREVWVQEGGF